MKIAPFHATPSFRGLSAAADGDAGSSTAERRFEVTLGPEVAGSTPALQPLSAAAPSPREHPAHVYAAETDTGGVHNCPRCGHLVIWGLTNRGKRARFDYPSDMEGQHANHHITCPLSPGKKRPAP